MDHVVVRTAEAGDLPRLRDVERAAGEAFRGIGMAEIADDEPLAVAELAAYQRDGRAWVVPDGKDASPVAYLLVARVDDGAHVEQVSVHPEHAGRRLGRSLLRAAERWGADQGLASLSLTTFAEVPWNAPYYLRLGFRVLDDDELGGGLRRIREHESARGLDRWPRVAMRRPLAPAMGG